MSVSTGSTDKDDESGIDVQLDLTPSQSSDFRRLKKTGPMSASGMEGDSSTAPLARFAPLSAASSLPEPLLLAMDPHDVTGKRAE